MAGKTTNLQLQKIDNTDYAGNFPTIYNNNLDLIDGLKSDLITSVAGKQDKLIAGDGITIADDGKTISSSTPGMTFVSGNIRDYFTVSNGVLTVLRDLLFIGTSTSKNNDIVSSVRIYAGKYSTYNTRFSSLGGHMSSNKTYPLVGLSVDLNSSYIWVFFNWFKSATDRDFDELSRLTTDTKLRSGYYKVYIF